VAAESDLEKTLVQIWEQLLHIDRIGVNDNFFELGGHSLLVIRMISACRNQLNIELNIREVFLFPTIALLSEHIQRGKDEINHLPVLIKSVRPQLIPLSFAQERLWFIDKLEGSSHYHIPFVIRLKGALKSDVLQRSFQQIVNRHEVLRTVIIEQNGAGFQYVKPENQWKLQEIECTKYSKSEVDALVKRLINAPFDLSQDDMIRVDLLNVNQDEFILVVTMHHIASDGWSISILANELVKIYNGYANGEQIDLPELPIQYADYAIWQRYYLKDELLENLLSYWKQKLNETRATRLTT
jgi:acyl carrier protein